MTQIYRLFSSLYKKKITKSGETFSIFLQNVFVSIWIAAYFFSHFECPNSVFLRHVSPVLCYRKNDFFVIITQFWICKYQVFRDILKKMCLSWSAFCELLNFFFRWKGHLFKIYCQRDNLKIHIFLTQNFSFLTLKKTWLISQIQSMNRHPGYGQKL